MNTSAFFSKFIEQNIIYTHFQHLGTSKTTISFKDEFSVQSFSFSFQKNWYLSFLRYINQCQIYFEVSKIVIWSFIILIKLYNSLLNHLFSWKRPDNAILANDIVILIGWSTCIMPIFFSNILHWHKISVQGHDLLIDFGYSNLIKMFSQYT